MLTSGSFLTEEPESISGKPSRGNTPVNNRIFSHPREINHNRYAPYPRSGSGSFHANRTGDARPFGSSRHSSSASLQRLITEFPEIPEGSVRSDYPDSPLSRRSGRASLSNSYIESRDLSDSPITRRRPSYTDSDVIESGEFQQFYRNQRQRTNTDPNAMHEPQRRQSLRYTPVVFERSDIISPILPDPVMERCSIRQLGVLQEGIARGSTAAVHLLTTPGGRKFVGKEIFAHVAGGLDNNLMHECEGLRRISNPTQDTGTCTHYGVASLEFAPGDVRRLLIMDHIDGPNGNEVKFKLHHALAQRLISENDAWQINMLLASELLFTARHAKNRGVVNSDFKPGNFSIEKATGSLKVYDWGGWTPVNTPAGMSTALYAPPEVEAERVETVVPVERTIEEYVPVTTWEFNERQQFRTPTTRYHSRTRIERTQERRIEEIPSRLDEKSDIFSIGRILEEMVGGDISPDPEAPKKFPTRWIDVNSEKSMQYFAFIDQMQSPSRLYRPTAQQALENPFFFDLDRNRAQQLLKYIAALDLN